MKCSEQQEVRVTGSDFGFAFVGGPVSEHAHHVINQHLPHLLVAQVEQVGQSRRGEILNSLVLGREKLHQTALELPRS